MKPPRRIVFAYPAGSAQQVVVLLLPALLVLVLEICFWQGMRASDDLDYAHLAQSLLQPGQAVMSVRSHHVARLGMTVPLAFVFSVFARNRASHGPKLRFGRARSRARPYTG